MSRSTTLGQSALATGLALFMLSASAGEAVKQGDGLRTALRLLRDRIAKAVGADQKVTAYILFAGSRTKVKLLRFEGDRVHVRALGMGVELPLAWDGIDPFAVTSAARRCVKIDDAEGILAVLTAYRALGKSDIAADVYGEILQGGNESLRARAKVIWEVNQPKIKKKTKPKREQKKQLRLPIWSSSVSWVRTARQFVVGPEGSPSNPGTRAAPWDLASTLSGERGVKAGDVVWVLGGTYKGCFTGKLRGTAEKPIIVRAVPGQRATLDGAGGDKGATLTVKGAWTLYWGLELTNSDPRRVGPRPSTYTVFGPNTRLINCIIHDGFNNGFWQTATGSEIYGCLIYNCGNEGPRRGHGHGCYAQNKEGKKRIADNIIFNNFSFGIHAYTTRGFLDGFDIIGNTWFGSGVASKVSGHKDDCLVGGLRPASRILLAENLGWARSPGTRCVRLGWSARGNKDVTLTGNYFAGATLFSKPWESVTMTGNTFIGRVKGVDTSKYPDNTYGQRPSQTKVFVRANQYEPGRAHITVFNWSNADAVYADISSALPVGASYEIRNAQNYYAKPVAAGIFNGKPVLLPMIGLEPVQPVGMADAIGRGEMTGKAFNVFVLVPVLPRKKAESS